VDNGLADELVNNTDALSVREALDRRKMMTYWRNMIKPRHQLLHSAISQRLHSACPDYRTTGQVTTVERQLLP
jgi:hypothetical protein